MNWLERFAWYRNQEPLLNDLVKIRDHRENQNEVDEQSEVRRMFRNIAKLIHPDLAVSEKDRALRNNLMSRVNQAYYERNEIELRKMLESLRIKYPAQ